MPSERAALRHLFKCPFSKLITRIAAALTLVAAVTFSLFLLMAILVVGGAAWAYFWWKKRQLRRTQEEQGNNTYAARQSRDSNRDGMIIEGEATRVADEHDAKHIPPRP